MDYEQLYNVYYMEVYSFVMVLARNQEIAEEITQKTFFSAINTRKKHRGESSEFTWLCAIAKNLFLDSKREEKRIGEIDEEAVSPVDVERIVEDEEMMLKIHQVLHTLEEPYKEVFHLRVFGELSFEKIGFIFGKTENWARVTYHRARLKVQERMDDK